MVEIRSTDDGLLLNGSILCLDSYHSKHISFLSSALYPFQNIDASIITTEETQRILQTFRRRPKALICQYNRPFSLGKLHLELLPSGGVLGGASLYVETGDSNFIYAPMLQTRMVPGLPSIQLKPAKIMVMNAPYPPDMLEAGRREAEVSRFLERIKKDYRSGKRLTVLCHPVSTAQEITQIVADEGIPVVVHPSIYQVNKIYEACGVKLGPYSRFGRRSNEEAVIILPHSRYLRVLPKMLRGGRVVYMVQNHLETRLPRYYTNIEDKFFFSQKASFIDIQRAIRDDVKPKVILVFGPYTKQIVDSLDSRQFPVRPLFQNNQPVLF
ncbi:MAG: hypothetical protein HYW48_09370 [Deltaproteobacteria bacterium]|nr:hypothetical protein [Deltaproteobacteria bacterium]